LHISLIPETIFHIGILPVTNTLLMGWLAVLVLVAFTFILRKKLREVPRGAQNVFEAGIDFFLETLEGVFGSKTQALKFFPLIFTIFLFVLTANWLGVVPGVGSIMIENGHGAVPLFRSATADLNTTFALATVSVLVIQFMGIYTLGFFRYAKRFVNLKGPMKFFIGLIELVSEFSKFIAFSFRLFGNIFGGKVLLTIMIFLVPLLLPLPFYAFEIFVGAIQAVIFSLLTAVFIKVATMDLAAEH